MTISRRQVRILYRFNRNIVECKSVRLLIIVPLRVRFNRNIVECKLDNTIVKQAALLGFNRNIVECKFVYVKLKSDCKHPDLIET